MACWRGRAFGEERARYWLDYARYADTYGLHYDNSRDIWPYRDYVIRSFNSNKPFDQFAVEQIAGDLLPAKNLDPLIASGYVRLGVSSNEGGAIPEELRVNIARESDRGLWRDIHGPYRRLRRLPRSQIRSDHAEGLLCADRVLQQH